MSNIPEARDRIRDIAAHLEYLSEAEGRLLAYLRRHRPKEGYLIWTATHRAALLSGLHEQLLELLPKMTREFTAPVAPKTSRRVTADLKRRMAQEKLDNPDVPMREIGERHGVDGGRVSEGVKALKAEVAGEALKPAFVVTETFQKQLRKLKDTLPPSTFFSH